MDLYKYCGSGGAEIFETRTIWFSQPEYLNDPFELNPSTSFREEDRKHLLKRIPGNYLQEFKRFRLPFKTYAAMETKSIDLVAPAIKEGRQKDLFADLNAQYALLCLSKTDQSLPMWAHYAEQYRGFVIHFDGKHEFFSPKNGSHVVRPVEYKKARPWVGLDDAKHDEAHEILYTKSPDWGYEQELRLVRNIRQGTLTEIAAGRRAYAFPLPPECIVSVQLGCRADTVLRARIEKNIAHPDFKHVSLHQANVHKDDFALQKEKLK